MGIFTTTSNATSALPHELVVSASPALTSPVIGPSVAPVSGVLKLQSPDVASGSWYWGIRVTGETDILDSGQARIADATHKMLWGSCSETTSDAAVWTQMQSENADFFMHLGDMNYLDINSTDEAVYKANLEATLGLPNQRTFLKNTPFVYMPDDHEIANDHAGNTLQTEALASALRKRLAGPALALTGPTDGRYCTWDIGRVRYVLLDQRRYASPRGDSDNASKTVLGATQKAWLFNILQNSTGMQIVIGSTRVFHAVQITGHDSWGGYTTERTEICDEIQANASGRVLFLTGDRHQWGYDDGTNCNYATISDPIRIGMAAPLHRISSTNTHGNGVFSSGVFSGDQQYGMLEIDDNGGAGNNLLMTLTGKNELGTVLYTTSWAVTL